MPEPLLLALALLAAAVMVGAPFVRTRTDFAAADDDDAAALRHRVALESLRDVEADRRAGSLDDLAYEAQRAEAEARAVETRAALDASLATRDARAPAANPGRSIRAPLIAGVLIGLAVLGAALVPAAGVANQTVVNRQLADAQEAESDRQASIATLLDRVAENPRDAAALSALADEYLAGTTQDDLVRAAVTLRLLIDVEPERRDAYERIITAYMRAGDYENARAAFEAYVRVPGVREAEIAFFEGLIALRGDRDDVAAVEAFDRFLKLAPDDPRAGMVRGLRDEAEARITP